MDTLGDELFSGSTLTFDQDGGGRWGYSIDNLEHLLHRRIIRDDEFPTLRFWATFLFMRA